MMKITVKTVLWIVLITCKTVSRKPCINREDNIKISQFNYTAIVLIITMKLLSVVTSPSIYQNIQDPIVW